MKALPLATLVVFALVRALAPAPVVRAETPLPVTAWPETECVKSARPTPVRR